MAAWHRRVLLLLFLLLGCALQPTRAFENPFAKWLEASEELLDSLGEEQQQQQQQADDDHHRTQPELEDLREEADEEEKETVSEEENESPSDAIPPPTPDNEPTPQSPPSPQYEPESQSQSPDAITKKQHAQGDRRLEEAAEHNDEPDEFADLEGIDLSPFNMYIADKAVLVRLLDWAYDRTAFLSRFQDGFVHAEELSNLALNPTKEKVPDEYMELIDAAADEMRDVQGLVDSEMAVPRGFVGRGMPLRTLQRLAQQMHEHHSQQHGRRLTGIASTGTRDREL